MKEYIYPDNGKYITKVGNSYRIRKQYLKNNKTIQLFFGTFYDYNEAIIYRDECIKQNWDKSLMLRQHPVDLKYISKKNGAWRIQYKREHFGQYSNLIDAINERDLLIANNWDLEKVCECTDDRIAGETVYLGKWFL